MSRASLKSRVAVVVAFLYFVPGLWVIFSSYSCGTMLCDLGAIVYSSLPVPFLKGFYLIGAFVQGVSWWEARWPLPGAPLAALSLIGNALTVYFAVVLIQRIFKRKSAQS